MPQIGLLTLLLHLSSLSKLLKDSVTAGEDLLQAIEDLFARKAAGQDFVAAKAAALAALGDLAPLVGSVIPLPAGAAAADVAAVLAQLEQFLQAL